MQREIDFLRDQLSPEPPRRLSTYTPTQISSMQRQLDTLSQRLPASTPSQSLFKSAGGILDDTPQSFDSGPILPTTFNRSLASSSAAEALGTSKTNTSKRHINFANNYEDQYSSGEEDVKQKKARVQTSWADNIEQTLPTIIAKHKRIFMDRAFGKADDDDGDDEHPDHYIKSQADLDHVINVVRNWGDVVNCKHIEDPIERARVSKFRNENKIGHKHRKKYHLEDVSLPNGVSRTVLRRIEKEGKVGRIVVSRESVFDAIDEWHRTGNGHMGQERTWTACKEKYFNCTQQLVRLYCELCPECGHKNPVVRPQRGSRKPIRSKTFRERFQVDLIDMRKLRKRDPFGVLMRWIVTVKDHATGFTMIAAIPRKRARYVGHVLQQMFGIVGYPFIFHTDNGKEFTGRAILSHLRRMNPNILTITGRPRKPNDQGSVESMNKMVKRVLNAVLAERRLKGENPNWTEVLGSVSAAINAQYGRGKYDVAAYTSVFGCHYNQEVSTSKEEARQCWTLPQRLKLTDDEEFKRSLEDDFYLSSASSQDENDSNDDPDNNDDWSDASETLADDEVDDETFDKWLTREDDSGSETEMIDTVDHLDDTQFSAMSTASNKDATNNHTSSPSPQEHVLVSEVATGETDKCWYLRRLQERRTTRPRQITTMRTTASLLMIHL